MNDVTLVTSNAVTPQAPSGYSGYAGYASKIAVPVNAESWPDFAPGESWVLGIGTAVCPSDITERAAIIAERNGCTCAEAESRALAEHGLTSWQNLSVACRVEIMAALDRLPQQRTQEATRLLDMSRKFIASQHFDQTIASGWRLIEVFGIDSNAPTTHLGTWGLIVTQALLLPSRIEAITDGHAILRTKAGAECLWPRFRSEIDACALWWQCIDIVR